MILSKKKLVRLTWLTILAVSAVLVTSIVPALAAQNRPILVIAGYKTDPPEVAPGAPFDLTLTLKNEGASRADQLLLTLQSDGPSASSPAVSGAGEGAQTASSQGRAAPISVLGSGNVRYIGDISSGSTQTITFRLISSGDSEPQAYNLAFLLEYSNSSSGRDESTRQSIGLPLVRGAALKLATLKLPSVVRVDKAFKITGDIINTGSFTVNGITAGAAGNNFEIVREAEFIGPLDGGDSDSFEIRLRPVKLSAREVTLTVSYKDDYNQERKITRAIKVAPEKAALADKNGDDKGSGGFFNSIARFFRALLGIGSGD